MKKIQSIALMLFLLLSLKISAQSKLYPKHFELEQVTLTDGPMKTAMEINFQTLMQYDMHRLLTPYVRQSGLGSTSDTNSPYFGWEQKHPSFPNWGNDNFNLDGHVGGHYLSALSLAYAACHDDKMKAQLKERMDYMVCVMRDCQRAYDHNTEGLYGFIGGQPINQSWKDLYAGNTATIRKNWGWVPFYCQHKILAGLRDAYIYGGSEEGKETFRKLADWSVNVIAKVNDSDIQSFLDCEHGGMNESLLDAYHLFGDVKYLTAAKRYTHKAMLDGMQTLDVTFLDNKHANTQVPKYIGMERIGEMDNELKTNAVYLTAAENFWTDVTQNRTVCIGGNSVAEHFLAAAYSNRYIDNLDGPESCNTNNMLKLSEMMFDRTADAKYVDFYEQAMWNHILSTQDPLTGGYVYFTSLRPQSYRVYSQVNQGMWCCVGTGMENHSKYGHFIYTHDGGDVLYVNLFTPSCLESDEFVVTQETQFPFEPKTTIIIGKAGSYTLSIRHPSWAADGFSIKVNGEDVQMQEESSYVSVNRSWHENDKVEVSLPMKLRYEVCPNYTDYIAFKYGPILLAAKVSPEGEVLPNEYAGAGRMDHAPGSMATPKNLLSAPLLIGSRSEVLDRIKVRDITKLTFDIDVSRDGVETYKWQTLTLQPFFQIHHSRYSCYWYQATAESFANSSMAQTEAANEALAARTLDFVAPGEQQSEAGHEYNYSSDSSKGNFNGENYRDAKAGGYVQYTLYNPEGESGSLSIICRFTTEDHGRKATLLVDGEKIADIDIPTTVKKNENGFFNLEYPIPASLVTDAKGNVKTRFVVRLAATEGTLNPGLYYLRLMKGYDPAANAYKFRAEDWMSGDGQRISADNISYDLERNVIMAKSKGKNNIALLMKYQDLDYDIDSSQKFLIIRGKNLSTASGASYLWWLNGMNRGSQVEPTIKKSIKVDGQPQVMIVWDMTKGGLYDNFTGGRPNVCLGQTIFGLTATKTDGSCEIHDINFASSIEDYIAMATHIAAVGDMGYDTNIYSLQGIRTRTPKKGVYIKNGRKFINHL